MFAPVSGLPARGTARRAARGRWAVPGSRAGDDGPCRAPGARPRGGSIGVRRAGPGHRRAGMRRDRREAGGEPGARIPAGGGRYRALWADPRRRTVQVRHGGARARCGITRTAGAGGYRGRVAHPGASPRAGAARLGAGRAGGRARTVRRTARRIGEHGMVQRAGIRHAAAGGIRHGSAEACGTGRAACPG